MAARDAFGCATGATDSVVLALDHSSEGSHVFAVEVRA